MSTQLVRLQVGLARVLTPSGLIRDFSRLVGLGVNRIMYTPWPGAPGPWIYEWGNDFDPTSPSGVELLSSALLQFIWSSGYRRFTQFPRQRRISFDKVTIQWNVDGLENFQQFDHLNKAPHVQLSDVTSGHQLTRWRTYFGTLLESERVEQRIPGARSAHPSLGGLLHARHVYTYNENLNVSFE